MEALQAGRFDREVRGFSIFSGGCKQPNLSTGAGRLCIAAAKLRNFFENLAIELLFHSGRFPQYYASIMSNEKYDMFYL